MTAKQLLRCEIRALYKSPKEKKKKNPFLNWFLTTKKIAFPASDPFFRSREIRHAL